MSLNLFILSRLKTVLFSILLIVFFCQPLYASVQVNILYDESNASSRLFKNQLVWTFFNHDIEHQVLSLQQFENISSPEPQSDEKPIFITLGSKALKIALGKMSDKNIFSLLVSQEKIKTILEASYRVNELSGLYLEQSLERQVLLAQQLIYGIRAIGFLTTSDNVEDLRNRLGNIQSEVDFEIKVVTDQTSLGIALSYVIHNSELLITQAEPKIYNRSSLKNILLSSYRNNIPLLGLNKAFVDAGCLGAVYTTSNQFVQETAEIINKAIKGEEMPEINYAKYYQISLNQNVAYSLGIHLQSEREMLIRMTSNELKSKQRLLREHNE